jgi:hypothetical protein
MLALDAALEVLVATTSAKTRSIGPSEEFHQFQSSFRFLTNHTESLVASSKRLDP